MHKDDLRLQLDSVDILEGTICEFHPRMRKPTF